MVVLNTFWIGILLVVITFAHYGSAGDEESSNESLISYCVGIMETVYKSTDGKKNFIQGFKELTVETINNKFYPVDGETSDDKKKRKLKIKVLLSYNKQLIESIDVDFSEMTLPVTFCEKFKSKGKDVICREYIEKMKIADNLETAEKKSLFKELYLHWSDFSISFARIFGLPKISYLKENNLTEKDIMQMLFNIQDYVIGYWKVVKLFVSNEIELKNTKGVFMSYQDFCKENGITILNEN